PSATFPPLCAAARAAPPAAVPRTPEVGASAGPVPVSRPPAGTDARPVLTPPGGDEDGAAPSGESGGAGIPGARVNLGAGPSPLTVARPTTVRPAPSADSAASESAAAGEADACVSVIN